MSNKKDIHETESANTSEQVSIDKTQLDAILAGYEEMKAQVAKLSEQSITNGNTDEARSLAEEQRLLAIVEEANNVSDEIVPFYADKGSIRSNENIEVSINGIQTVAPRGESVELKRSVIEVIKNSEKQKAISMGLQEKRKKEAERAEAEGGIKE